MKPSLTIWPDQQAYFIKPGLHSHNSTRRVDRHPSRYRVVRFVRTALFLLGLCGIAYYGYTLSDEYIYQAYENWAFDQKITGRQVTFTDYVREQTPFGFLTAGLPSTPRLVTTGSTQPGNVQPATISRPIKGSVLGRVQITRLNLSAIVREGVDKETLSRAVGHLPYTALPGQIGNFAIAAHRDTLFRALKDIQEDDRITFQSRSGTYTYEVTSTKIVKPSDLSVVQPQGTTKLLTMITCYPFYYIGSAPKRFTVQAKLVGSLQHAGGASNELSTRSQDITPPQAGAGVNNLTPAAQAKGAARVKLRKPRRTQGFFHSSRSRSSHASSLSHMPRTRSKKPSF
jgi:sortase A